MKSCNICIDSTELAKEGMLQILVSLIDKYPRSHMMERMALNYAKGRLSTFGVSVISLFPLG
jgi:hypothetical protein